MKQDERKLKGGLNGKGCTSVDFNKKLNFEKINLEENKVSKRPLSATHRKLEDKNKEVKKEDEIKEKVANKKEDFNDWFKRHSKSTQTKQSKNSKQEDKKEEEIKYEQNSMDYEQWFYKHSGKIHEINDSIEKALGTMRAGKEKFDNFDVLEQQLNKIEEKKVNLSDINTNISYVTKRLKAIISYFKSIKSKEQENLNTLKSAISKNSNKIRDLKKALNRYNNIDEAKAKGLVTYFKQQQQKLNKDIESGKKENNKYERDKNDSQTLINEYNKNISQFENKLKLLKHISAISTPIKVKQQTPRKLFENKKTDFVLYKDYLYFAYEKSHYTRTRKYIRIPIKKNKCMLDNMEIETIKNRKSTTVSKANSNEIKDILKNGTVPLYNKKIFDLSSLRDREINIVK